MNLLVKINFQSVQATEGDGFSTCQITDLFGFLTVDLGWLQIIADSAWCCVGQVTTILRSVQTALRSKHVQLETRFLTY